MFRLAIRFPAGRFHATPWGRHVNEGATEWPMSPWRLVRALVAAHFSTPGAGTGDPALAAVLKLDVAPSFTLPPASEGHTRHYMSLNQRDRQKTALVFDAFIALDRSEAAVVHWPVELTAAERDAISGLAARVSYLGRAESWCEMRVLGPEEEAPPPNCLPVGEIVLPGVELVRVLCPAQGAKLEDVVRTTSELQKEGWSNPPGSAWVAYGCPRRTSGAQFARHAATSGAAAPTVAEFALGGAVLPLFTEGVRVAEQIRAAALARHGTPSMTLAGKDADGKPLSGPHNHAHYVCDARGRMPRVTHVLVWAPAGFTAQEQDALSQISYLTQRDNKPTLDVVLAGFGRPEHFAKASRLFGTSTRWRSKTPFIPPRHPKAKSDAPEDQVASELARRGFPAPTRIERCLGAALSDPRAGDSGLVRWCEFETSRRRYKPTTPAMGFEVTFDHPVAGPILLGFGSHYGLGEFEAVGTLEGGHD